MGRRRLPDERESITHSFRVGEYDGHLVVGLHDDGSPGEIFIFSDGFKNNIELPEPPESLMKNEDFAIYYSRVSNQIDLANDKFSSIEGFVKGIMGQFSIAISIALQYNVPLGAICDKFSHTRFPPEGMTSNNSIRIATSIPDYIFRWLRQKFLED